MYDKNLDGQVNDGSELFGVKSGDGFWDLSAYDDENEFIDQGEPIFEQLQIWKSDSEGNKTLTSLQDKNIAALYLDSVDSPYRLVDIENNKLGSIRSSRFFLDNTGVAGMVHQIDWVV